MLATDAVPQVLAYGRGPLSTGSAGEEGQSSSEPVSFPSHNGNNIRLCLFRAPSKQMWLLLLVVLLSVVVYAQGADTIELGDLNYNRAQNQLEFSFAFNGNSSHQLHNVSLELILEGNALRGLSDPDNGDVVDIIGINYSEKADISYQLHTISWLDPVRVRANGTTYSGATALENITALSSLPEYLEITLDPCGNVSAVVVNSTADPTYTPWRIIHPAGFDVFAQADLGTPNAAIKYALYKVDQLVDSLADMTVTIELINNATGVSVDRQALSPKNFFSTTNLTIDQGAWKAWTFHLESSSAKLLLIRHRSFEPTSQVPVHVMLGRLQRIPRSFMSRVHIRRTVSPMRKLRRWRAPMREAGYVPPLCYRGLLGWGYYSSCDRVGLQPGLPCMVAQKG
ncbi:hypothetical protein B0H16DRAFT_1617272 [Mycena metata]|uniref:Uncharacterized protein n=1 Tax=Mycena metata TaxID=1033252 RepID=A0AAD7MFK1_9AGAR|nr:hypothetical protein B0H16DRAFT_1617272 [Mycena metata]